MSISSWIRRFSGSSNNLRLLFRNEEFKGIPCCDSVLASISGSSSYQLVSDSDLEAMPRKGNTRMERRVITLEKTVEIVALETRIADHEARLIRIEK